MVILWVLVAGALLVAEVLTIAFYALFVAVAAGGAAVAAAAGAPVWVQAIVLVGVTLFGIALGRPPLAKLVGPHRSVLSLASHGAGRDLLGREALTVDLVGDTHHPGHVVLGGERWLAVTEAPEPLPPDTAVTVLDVKGTTLVVWP